MTVIFTFLGLVCILGSVYDWQWLWDFRGAGRWLDKQIGHSTARVLVGVAGVLLIYSQLRLAVDAFTGSVVGQALFFAGAAGLIFMAFKMRGR